ncbi:hypothetical protein ACJJTC_004837 [Scirpophaga incertulas]
MSAALQIMNGNYDSAIQEEIGALTSILSSDVIISTDDGVPTIETMVYPQTANDIDQQFVCLTIRVTLPQGYPDTSPNVDLRNPRGLDDESLQSITVQIKKRLTDYLGSPVIYEIIGIVQENLTDRNRPSEKCVICLYNFEKEDVFIRTQCYHYFHNHCFGKHLVASENNYKEELEKVPTWKRAETAPYQQTCPICRSTVEFEAETLKSSPPPVESLTDPPFKLTPEIKALQEEMAALKLRQVEKGGSVIHGDSGPPPLTITSPSDKYDEATGGPSGTTQEAPKAQEVPKTQEDAKAQPAGNNRGASNNNGSPGSPKPAYTGPYRGFNRRGKPGRRGRGSTR